MELGAFSISLAVADLATSRAFYEKLGFACFGGDASNGYVMMNNGDAVIGLFQGMFEGHILTFNPGWNQAGDVLPSFADVREIQEELRAQGLALESEVDAATVGPASIVLIDPDGNSILIDQHV